MKSLNALNLLSVALVLVACSDRPRPVATQPALPDGLQSRFADYCDETGSLGIGFVAWHTYDYRFRQCLRRSQDPELKRLYVLENLHRETEVALDDLEKGIIRTGKSSSRPLSTEEWQAAHRRVLQQIEDLAKYTAFTNFAISTQDPMDPPDPHPMYWVQTLREKLDSITNVPGTGPQGGANGSQPVRSMTNSPPSVVR